VYFICHDGISFTDNADLGGNGKGTINERSIFVFIRKFSLLAYRPVVNAWLAGFHNFLRKISADFQD
jgi:hypothetical protein